MGENDLLRAGEVADLLGISQPNVHKFLRLRGIKPVAKHPIGKLYDRATIERVKADWLAGRDGLGAPGGRVSDKKRKASALRNASK